MFRELSIAAFFLALAETGPWEIGMYAGTTTTGLCGPNKGCPLSLLARSRYRLHPIDAALILGINMDFAGVVSRHADYWGTSVTDDTKRALAQATGVALP